MPNLITVKIDVKKLDKSRFFQGKPDRDGHSPLYADLVLIARRELGKFGDTHIVKQSKKKDEVIELPIIGSATERGIAHTAPAPANTPPPQVFTLHKEENQEDVPF